jgi:hypothetical protein
MANRSSSVKSRSLNRRSESTSRSSAADDNEPAAHVMTWVGGGGVGGARCCSCLEFVLFGAATPPRLEFRSSVLIGDACSHCSKLEELTDCMGGIGMGKLVLTRLGRRSGRGLLLLLLVLKDDGGGRSKIGGVSDGRSSENAKFLRDMDVEDVGVGI